MELPKDGAMLASFVNMKLRDEYDSLSSLCEDLDQNEEELRERLREAGYEYLPSAHAFRPL